MRIDDRLFEDFGPKDLVVGVETNGEVRAYPEPVIRDRGGVVADVVGGERVVVFASADGLDVYRDPGLSFERTRRTR